MKHAYVVFDNDAPLFVCGTLEQAEAVIKREKETLERELLGPIERSKSSTVFSSEVTRQVEQEAKEKLRAHFLHYHMVPYAVHN